jgi:hypothetical protein
MMKGTKLDEIENEREEYGLFSSNEDNNITNTPG